MPPTASPQLDLLDGFATAKPGLPLFCHQDFLEKLERYRSGPIGKRASLLLQRLLVDERRQHYKATQGVNRGWRRSRLGGTGGSHFYAWWCPKGAAPLKDGGFEEAPEGAIILRDIRHHDDHSPLPPQSLGDHYLPVTVSDIRREEYGPAPWTPPQAKFAGARQPVRVLKGHPGSGKTTALWHAADQSSRSALYVTYSRDLAALAREHFDRYCSREKRFRVVTFPDLVRALAGRDVPAVPVQESRRRFVKEIASLSARTLGQWSDHRSALFDELHAHYVGAALPIAVGRFPASAQRHLSDKAYRALREPMLGTPAVKDALEVVSVLRRRDEQGDLERRHFPELELAWLAVERLRAGEVDEAAWLQFDCLAVDEAQDLTPVEALVLTQLASALRDRRRTPPTVLVAGDEAQTVRPTDFEWGWMNDLLHHQLASPAEHKLGANLRSPRRIAELVNRVWDFYSHLSKQERPGGVGLAEIDEEAADQVTYCAAAPGPDLDQLLGALCEREGLAVLTLDEGAPAYMPEPLRGRVLTVSEAKGLDFQAVCVLDAGRHLARIMKERRSLDPLESLSKRLAIDQLRVVLSRPTERLYWLDVSPNRGVVEDSLAFLNGHSIDATVSPVIPAVVLKSLEEDLLDVEERIRLCEADARQFLDVKPEMAWSRAKQAVALAGPLNEPGSVQDVAVRKSAHLTLAQVAFSLAIRNALLPAELGHPDLHHEAVLQASLAANNSLAVVLDALARVRRATTSQQLPLLGELAQLLVQRREHVPAWLLVELQPQLPGWLDQLEGALSQPAGARYLARLLPELYDILGLPEAAARGAKTRQRAVGVLVKSKEYADALALVQALPEPPPKLLAECHEGVGDFAAAAGFYQLSGNLKEAIRCFRAVPDLDRALALMAQVGDHPAAESLQWVRKMQRLVAQRPEAFPKVVTAEEKKLLEAMLEQSLGVARKKTVRKATKRAAKKVK